ncbi:site-specific integrase [Wenyingzhuangia aestuarii]|uniref:site-specific integrase n=1 Tax=Wenyingzhuangia aestuarii TaxID=1647582 RepID=UPI00143AAF0C|nr:site-specific integrase [Wenyingzhuangia aestuarii]NJB82803.1 integrase [Wenyingzhuangia aestuarii]
MSTLKTVLHPKKDNKGNTIFRLTLRLTVKRKRSYLQLLQNINPEHWDAHAEKLNTKHPKHKQLNRLIRKKYGEIEDYILEMESKNKSYTAIQVMDAIKNHKEKQTFFELAKEHIEDLTKLEKHNRAISDQSKINRIKEFAKNENLSFEEIDENFLKKLKIYLAGTGTISERSIMNIYVLIRLLYNNAIRKNLVDQKFYPFGKGKIKIKYPETIKIGLDEMEIRKIKELDLSQYPEISKTRDVFLFSFYLAGIRIGDVLEMEWKDIVDDRIYYKMGKNNKIVSLKTPTQIIEILSRYEQDKVSNSDYIFPHLKYVSKKELKKVLKKDSKKLSKKIYTATKTQTKKLNANLKKLGIMAEIDKKITNHIARHSFGNIAGDKISPQMLQKLYRHTHLSTTIGYQGNFIHKSADDALDSILTF